MNLDASTLRLLRESQGQSIEGKGNRHFAHFPQEELGDKIKVPSNIFLSWKQSCAKQRRWHNAQVPPITTDMVLRHAVVSSSSLGILM